MPSLEYLIPTFLVLLLSLSVHEAAHAWSADKLGDPTARRLGRITINPLAHIDWIGTVLFPLIAFYYGVPLIGWAKPVPVNTRNLRAPRRDFAVIAAAGPISNLVLAVSVAIAVAIAGGLGSVTSLNLALLLQRAVLLNVSLAIFNLIPVPPLDGGNVAAGLLPEGAAHAINQLRPYGIFILYALMLAGVLDRFVFPIARDIADRLV